MVGAKDRHCDRKEGGPKQCKPAESPKMIEMIALASIDSNESNDECRTTGEVRPKDTRWNRKNKQCENS